MSKVLKVIADILLILFILAAAAIFVPPLFGVTTAIATPEVTTNMSQGSVAYGKRVPLDQLASGDTIIYNGDDYALLCEVESVDLEKDIVTVDVENTTHQIQFHNSAPRKLVVIPIIGYMSIALQSFEGRIILALVAALIVVLFIVSEVWGNKEKDDRDYERGEEEDDDEYFRSLARKTEARNTASGNAEARAERPARPDPFAAADAGISGMAAAGTAAGASASEIPNDKTMDLSEAVTAAAESGTGSAEEAEPSYEEAVPAEEILTEENVPAEDTVQKEEAPAEAAAETISEEVPEEIVFAEETPAEETVIKEAAPEETISEDTVSEKTASDTYEAASAPEAAIPAAAAAAAVTAAVTAADETSAETADTEAAAETAAAEAVKETGTPAGRILQDDGAEDLSDLNDEQMEGMESALETALAKAEEADKTDHSQTAAPPAAGDVSFEAADDTPDEIELAIPVRTLEEVLQEAYSNGDDPHIRKDQATGITLVDFSESFARNGSDDWN